MGESACFLSATCLACGRFIESNDQPDVCPHCGGNLDGSTDIDLFQSPAARPDGKPEGGSR